ncbi:MAG: V-type ATP synthase subunit F [Desulfobulbaceae bacterium]
MKGCVFLTANDARHGFGLAGFRQVVAGPGTLVAELEKIVRRGDAGLVIIDERLLSGADEVRLHVLEKNWPGALVVLPASGVDEGGGVADYGNRLIARVLGYQMKLS